jgi:hypothetical protein
MPRQWTCGFGTEPLTMHDIFEAERIVQECTNDNVEDLMLQQVGKIVLQSSYSVLYVGFASCCVYNPI